MKVRTLIEHLQSANPEDEVELTLNCGPSKDGDKEGPWVIFSLGKGKVYLEYFVRW